MIVLDENCSSHSVLESIRQWYGGRVCSVCEVLPGAVVKDELVPRLLRTLNRPTFVTTNVKDFWQVLLAEVNFCIVCVPVPNERHSELSGIIRGVLGLGLFRSKKLRMGHILLVQNDAVRYYNVNDPTIHTVERGNRAT